MIGALTFEEAKRLLAGRVDAGWLAELESTPDGQALLGLAIDMFTAADAEDAARASALFVVPHSCQVAPPASGPQYASCTMQVKLRRSLKTTRPILLPVDQPVQTPDGHVFLLKSALSWGIGEVGVAKTCTAVAVLPGRMHIPPGEIRTFKEVVGGLSGVGLAIDLLPGGGTQPKALRLKTDLAVPHAFRPEQLGRYVELTGFAPAGAGNEGRHLQLFFANDGSGIVGPQASENEYAWGPSTTTTSDAWMSPWVTGTFGFTWRVVEWNELFEVENLTAASGGALATLDEIAQERGRPRQQGEGDEQVRSRLARRNNPPSPLGALRAAVNVLAAYGFGLPDVRIYELGEPAPESIDPYKANFPAALGFISDLHTTDMSTPETPDGMANQSPTYTTLSPFYNPGLALLEQGATRWAAIVRWDPPGSMPSGTVAQVRRLLFAALKAAKPPGCLVQLYSLNQWGYP
jgi:hypothetical protein